MKFTFWLLKPILLIYKVFEFFLSLNMHFYPPNTFFKKIDFFFISISKFGELVDIFFFLIDQKKT
jgi:hypothetical protein